MAPESTARRRAREAHAPTLRLVRDDTPLTLLRLFDGGSQAFPAVLRRIEGARRSIDIRSFLWRDDAAGNTLARALLDAADRGVKVSIKKDRVGANYEYFGGNKQSFFHKRVDMTQRLQTWFLDTVYPNWGLLRQRPNPLAKALLVHPNCTIAHERKTFDHSKLFVFDDRHVIVGSMGIGDNHRGAWIDVMVEAEGEDVVARLQDRVNGRAGFDPARELDFLVQSHSVHPRGACPMLEDRLALIDGARHRLTIEMAYLGDRRFTEAMARAVDRGVEVSLVTAAMADIIGAQNRATCNELMRLTGAPDNLSIVLLPRMVHSKVVVVDGLAVDVGSANFTTLSHGVYEEVNLYVQHPGFAARMEQLVAGHMREGVVARSELGYSRLYCHVERAIVRFQSRAVAG